MYSVSLLPYEYKMLHQSARKSNYSLLAAVAVMGVFLAVYLFLSLSAGEKDAKLQDLKAQNASVEENISNLESLEVMNNEVGRLLSQAILAAGTNPSWNDLIAAIGNSVPETMGLKTITMKYAGDSGECTIQGTSKDQRSVSEWMEALEALDGTANVKCNFSGLTDQEEGLFEFELVFVLTPGPGYQLPPEVN